MSKMFLMTGANAQTNLQQTNIGNHGYIDQKLGKLIVDNNGLHWTNYPNMNIFKSVTINKILENFTRISTDYILLYCVTQMTSDNKLIIDITLDENDDYPIIVTINNNVVITNDDYLVTRKSNNITMYVKTNITIGDPIKIYGVSHIKTIKIYNWMLNVSGMYIENNWYDQSPKLEALELYTYKYGEDETLDTSSTDFDITTNIYFNDSIKPSLVKLNSILFDKCENLNKFTINNQNPLELIYDELINVNINEPIEIDIPSDIEFIHYDKKLIVSDDKLTGAISEEGEYYIGYVTTSNNSYIIKIVVKSNE